MAGGGPLGAVGMSVTVYAGSGQYLGVSLLDQAAPLVQVAFLTLIINFRHLVYGLSMLEKFKGMGWRKLYMIFALTDETYALVVNGAPEGTDEHLYYFLLSLFDHCYWVAGSVFGALIGTALTFDTTGIDFAMTALFVTIFTEQLLAAEDYFPAVTGVFATVLSLVLFGPDAFLIPAMLLISVVLAVYGLFQMKREKAAETDSPAAGREEEER